MFAVKARFPSCPAKGATRLLLVALFVGSVAALGCDDEEPAPEARARLQQKDFGRIESIVQEDLVRHRRGLAQAAEKIAQGFEKGDPAAREAEMRAALKSFRSTRKGIQELVVSPLSFLAVVDSGGKVIARDLEPDPMRGMDMGGHFAPVGRALAGEAAEGLVEFENDKNPSEPSISILLAAPVRVHGQVVGAVVLGIPLWRLAQRLSRQLQVEEGPGTVIWVYVYRGDRLFHHGTPPELSALLPDGAARRAGYAEHPAGFVGTARLYGRAYAYGVHPLAGLGADTGYIVLRMEP